MLRNMSLECKKLYLSELVFTIHRSCNLLYDVRAVLDKYCLLDYLNKICFIDCESVLRADLDRILRLIGPVEYSMKIHRYTKVGIHIAKIIYGFMLSDVTPIEFYSYIRPSKLYDDFGGLWRLFNVAEDCLDVACEYGINCDLNIEDILLIYDRG